MWPDPGLAFAFGGGLSALVALLHVAIIFGGGAWYRFFGAGERMACAAEAGRLSPAIVTTAIALMFALWAAYAFSGAGMLPPLPLRRAVLTGITAVYLLRGVVLAPLLVARKARPLPFVLWSSAISAVIGAAHLLGLVQVWSSL